MFQFAKGLIKAALDFERAKHKFRAAGMEPPLIEEVGQLSGSTGLTFLEAAEKLYRVKILCNGTGKVRE